MLYHEWKKELFDLLIVKGMKKKKAKKIILEFEEEYNLGDTPEDIAKTISIS